MISEILGYVLLWMAAASALALSIASTIEVWDLYKTRWDKIKSVSLSVISAIALIFSMVQKFYSWLGI